jgi:hypothetical protein
VSENRCEDCGGTPRARGDVEIEEGRWAICTSRFHANLVEREAGAYEYLDEKFVVLHTTSVPMTDREALEYFPIVEQWFNEMTPKYITKRAVDGHEFKMLPYTYDADTGEVTPIEGA